MILLSAHAGLSVSVASVGWWLGTILSGEISPFLLSSSLGTAGTLILHAVICALGFIFVLLLLPETKVKLWHLSSRRTANSVSC